MAAEVLATRGPLRHGLRPDALGRPQAAHGGPGRAEPDPFGGSRATSSPAMPRPSRICGPRSRPSVRRTCAPGARAWGRRPSWARAGACFPRPSRPRRSCAPGCARLEGLGVRFALRHRWQGWDDDGALAFTDAAGEPVRIEPDATILALGGASWPRLGSDGTWVGLLARRGRRRLAPAAGQYGLHLSVVRGHAQPLRGRAPEADRPHLRGQDCEGRGHRHGGRDRGRRRLRALGTAARRHRAERRAALLHIDLRPDLPEEALAKRLSAPRKGQSASTFLRKAAGLAPGRDRPAAGGVPCPAGGARCARPPHQGRAPAADRHEIPGAGHFHRRRRAVRGAGRAPDAAAAAGRLRRRRDARLGGAHRRLPAAGQLRHRHCRGERRSEPVWGFPMPH